MARAFGLEVKGNSKFVPTPFELFESLFIMSDWVFDFLYAKNDHIDADGKSFDDRIPQWVTWILVGVAIIGFVFDWLRTRALIKAKILEWDVSFAQGGALIAKQDALHVARKERDAFAFTGVLVEDCASLGLVRLIERQYNPGAMSGLTKLTIGTSLVTILCRIYTICGSFKHDDELHDKADEKARTVDSEKVERKRMDGLKSKRAKQSRDDRLAREIEEMDAEPSKEGEEIDVEF